MGNPTPEWAYELANFTRPGGAVRGLFKVLTRPCPRCKKRGLVMVGGVLQRCTRCGGLGWVEP